MPAQQRGLFRTVGMRMLNFGRRLMRHYVQPLPALPPPRYTPPPSWEADTQTPLIWNEEQEAARPEPPPSAPSVFEAPPVSEPAPAPRPAPQRRAPASVQRKEADEQKIDPRLLAILDAHQQRENRATQIREERKAAEAAEIQRQIDEGATDAPLPSRRRHRASFDYVETKPLMPPDEEISQAVPPKTPPADTIQTARIPDHEADDDDTEESSQAGMPTADLMTAGEVPAESSLPPVVQRAPAPEAPTPPLTAPAAPERTLQRQTPPVTDDASAAPVSAPANTPANMPPVVQRQMDAPPEADIYHEETFEAESAADTPPAPLVQRSPASAAQTPLAAPQPPTPPGIQRRSTPPTDQAVQRDIQSDDLFDADQPVSDSPAVQRQMDAPPAVPPETIIQADAPRSHSPTQPPIQRDMQPDEPDDDWPVESYDAGPGTPPAVDDLDTPMAESGAIQRQIDDVPVEYASPGAAEPHWTDAAPLENAAPGETVQRQADDTPLEDLSAGEPAAYPMDDAALENLSAGEAVQRFTDEEPSADSAPLNAAETRHYAPDDWLPSAEEDTERITYDVDAPQLSAAPAAEPPIQRDMQPDEAWSAAPGTPPDMADDPGAPMAEAEAIQRQIDDVPLEYAPPSAAAPYQTDAAPLENTPSGETVQRQADDMPVEDASADQAVQRALYEEAPAEPPQYPITDWSFPITEEDTGPIYFDVDAPQPSATPAAEPPAQPPSVQRQTTPTPIQRDMQPDEAWSAAPEVPADDWPAAPYDTDSAGTAPQSSQRDLPPNEARSAPRPAQSTAQPLVQRAPAAPYDESSAEDAGQAAEAEPESKSLNQHAVDVFQALVAAGIVPPSPGSAPAQPTHIARKADLTAQPPPAEEDMEAPAGEADVYQAMIAAGMVAPPAGQISRQEAPPEPRSSAQVQRQDSVPVQYAGEPNLVQRAETTSSESESSSSDDEGEGNDVNVDKLARDVYGVLRNRLRIEKERRG